MRKTRTARSSKIKHEVLVTFVDRGARDFAMSHAKNLPKDDANSHGVRLDYPEFLAEDF